MFGFCRRRHIFRAPPPRETALHFRFPHSKANSFWKCQNPRVIPNKKRHFRYIPVLDDRPQQISFFKTFAENGEYTNIRSRQWKQTKTSSFPEMLFEVNISTCFFWKIFFPFKTFCKAQVSRANISVNYAIFHGFQGKENTSDKKPWMVWSEKTKTRRMDVKSCGVKSCHFWLNNCFQICHAKLIFALHA